ncbi:MAG: hypothetical protein K1060chlam1_00957 [Candidatus Anoxychlamydiales bacterium]|nr:hypothetical protein [Candidatus Anoxychlamydiales bacterium]
MASATSVTPTTPTKITPTDRYTNCDRTMKITARVAVLAFLALTGFVL